MRVVFGFLCLCNFCVVCLFCVRAFVGVDVCVWLYFICVSVCVGLCV